MRILRKLKNYLLIDKPKSAAISLLIEIPLQTGKILRKAIAGSALGLGLAFVYASPSYSISFLFDYSRDTNGFFTDQTRRDRLEEAASYYTSFTDNLNSICSSGCDISNTWTPAFFHPATGVWSDGSVNQVIPANTLIIYAGGRDLGGSLGVGGAGGYNNTSTDLVSTIKARGQSGALATTPTDYAAWGGSITFTTNSTYTWDFSSAASSPASGKFDFLSVAIHELGHVMGFNSGNPSWSNKISGASFTGVNSVDVYGGTVSVSPDQSHWADGTTSTLPGTNTVQETAMDPTLMQGTRKLLTRLDYAGFKDIGWEVPDSFTAIPFEFKPDAAIAMLGICMIGNKLWQRNRKSRK
jgi:hypothetical protein